MSCLAALFEDEATIIERIAAALAAGEQADLTDLAAPYDVIYTSMFGDSVFGSNYRLHPAVVEEISRQMTALGAKLVPAPAEAQPPAGRSSDWYGEAVTSAGEHRPLRLICSSQPIVYNHTP